MRLSAGVGLVGRSHPVHGHGRVVVDPDDVFALQVAARLGHEAAIGRGRGGGLLGALIGWNIPEERVKDYEEGIKNGGILMGVKSKSDEDAVYFENEWKQHRGQHIYR